MKVSEVMTSDVETVSPDATVQEAAQSMARIDAGALPVVETGRLIGIVTDRDIAIRAVGSGMDPLNTCVRDIMSSEVQFTYAHNDVDDVADIMADVQVRRMPVIDGHTNVVGIVSLADLAREKRPRKVGEALQAISRPGGQHNA
jgi:CBS domain-containing protein